MKIAIIDDNNQEQLRLKQHIFDWSQQCGIAVSVEIFDSGEEFMRGFTSDRFDIVFMDIIMNGQSGIETARSLRKVSLVTLLIFITSSSEFMSAAFPCHAFDYVIKPYTGERISEVLNEARRSVGSVGEVIEIASEKFMLYELFYAYSDSNYCDIFTASSLHKVRISFKELSDILSAYPGFMVVGRGVIVNFDNTSHISGFDCIMTNGDRVPVSRRKIKETEQAFMNRQFSRLLSEGK